MLQTPIEQTHLSLDAFTWRYDSDGPFEFIEGVYIPVNPGSIGHGLSARRTVSYPAHSMILM